MAQEIKKVIIVGASGNLGRQILDALVASGRFNIAVLTRDSSTATFPSSVKVHKTDFSDESIAAAFIGQDAVISALGMHGGMENQPKLVDAAAKAGVKRFLPSEFSANILAPGVLELLPAFQTKVDLLEQLKGKEKDGLTWTGLCIGPLSDWGLKMGIFGIDLATNEALIYEDGNTRFAATSLKGLGDAVVAVLGKPAETANRYIYVSSLTTTQNEMVAALEKATGKSYNIKKVTTEEQVKLGKVMLSKGDMKGIFPIFQAAFFGIGWDIRSDFERDEKDALANDLLGMPQETVEETVKKALGG